MASPLTETQQPGEPAPASSPAPSNLSRGMRETIEAVVFAFALAFLFKAFQAEAFVIPTGSMAPTLMGRHKDVECPACGFRYSANASEEANRDGSERNDPATQVVRCTCPSCRFPMTVDPLDETLEEEYPSYSGDRIWVSKVPYELMEPKRWDVVVFRFPEEAETYYIKRLVGLPNETVRILHGDVFTRAQGQDKFELQRKPPEKLLAMSQVVHDNDCVSLRLEETHWPERWQAWPETEKAGGWTSSDHARVFTTSGSTGDGSAGNGGAGGENWIRYQHIVPSEANWNDLEHVSPERMRPQLITDFCAFNARVLRNGLGSHPSKLGLHWVGDLILDCELSIASPQGTALFDLVKGGRHFRCAIDAASGQAELTIDGLDDWRRTGATPIRGGGANHKVKFANADRQLLLWIDGKLITFDQPTTYDDLDNDRPREDEQGGDLAPLGVGSRGAAMTVSHLRVLRDIYYIAQNYGTDPISDFRPSNSSVLQMNREELADFYSQPKLWERPGGGSVFDLRQPVDFRLDADQFFVLGDNSPASSDARLWSQHFVPRDLLVGKALFVYWPHPLDLSIPFTNASVGVIPNFSGMGLIR